MISGGVIAHRGASGHAPENTLAAFRKAYDQGVRWVEFDVRLSADDELIYQLDAGSWFAPQYAMYRINPRRRLGLLYEQHDWLDWAKRLNVFAIHKVADTFSRADIEHYQALGYPVIVGIVNDAQQARQLFDWGVAGIFSDYPDRAMVK
jgi:glycerophosphoryl diester phosphodiesterase